MSPIRRIYASNEFKIKLKFSKPSQTPRSLYDSACVRGFGNQIEFWRKLAPEVLCGCSVFWYLRKKTMYVHSHRTNTTRFKYCIYVYLLLLTKIMILSCKVSERNLSTVRIALAVMANCKPKFYHDYVGGLFKEPRRQGHHEISMKPCRWLNCTGTGRNPEAVLFSW